ncbi:hypothetical protein D3C81_913420 [compost metagenome]
MDELDDRRQLVVLRAGAADRVTGQHHQHRPQAFATGGDDVVGDLVDQDNVGGQAPADQGIHGSHVRCGKGLDGGQAQRGAEVFDEAHTVASWGTGRL